MLLIDFIFIVFGFVFLVVSANFAIKRVIRISRWLGFSEYIVSFIAVGVIAVLPEFMIGINSALENTSSFGLGVIFGANIADLTLIIGIMAFFAPAVKMRDKVIKKAGFMLLLISLPVVFLLDGEISRFDGIILLLCFLFYVFKIVTSEHPLNKEFAAKEKINIGFEIIVLFFALAVLFASSFFITEGAKSLSEFLAFPVFFIGIILAVGTCLPELIFSTQASNKSHIELGFGDILGNVFADCTLTIGVISILSPIRPVQNNLAVASGAFMIVAFLVIIFLFNQKKEISKRIGISLIFLYIFFLLAQFVVESLILAGAAA
ncbi:MAG: sodium:calcium antiporter [archaeon]